MAGRRGTTFTEHCDASHFRSEEMEYGAGERAGVHGKINSEKLTKDGKQTRVPYIDRRSSTMPLVTDSHVKPPLAQSVSEKGNPFLSNTHSMNVTSYKGARPKQSIIPAATDSDSRNVQHAWTFEKYTETEPNKGGKEECCEIVISVSYKIRATKGTTEHYMTERFPCSVNDYMTWKYAMNSPNQLDKCKTHLSTSGEDLNLCSDSSVKINSIVSNEEHVLRIVKNVKSYIITTLGVVLTIDTVTVEGTDIRRATAQMNASFGLEIAYAEAIDGYIYIVFPTTGSEIVNKHISEWSNSTANDTIEETVKLKMVLYNFKHVLEKSIQTKGFKLTLTFGMKQDHLSCVVSGPKRAVRDAISNLKKMETSLKEREVIFTTRTNNALHKLNIKDILKHKLKLKHPACVLEQAEQFVCVYCFNAVEVIEAAKFVGGLIKEWTTLLSGKQRENKKDIVDHFQNKYGDRIVVDVDSTCRLYMVGLKEAIEQAQCEFVDVQEGRVSLTSTGVLPKSQPEITEYYPIRIDVHFRFIEKSVYSVKATNKFKVNLAFLNQSYTVAISGSVENVKAASKCIKKLDKDVVTECVLISQAKTVGYLQSDAGTVYMHHLERDCDVLIEKQSIHTLSNDGVQVSKEPHGKYITWSTSEGTFLMLENCCIEQVVADVKIIPTLYGQNRGHGHIATNVDAMVIHEWIDGRHSESQKLNDSVSHVLADAHCRKKRSIAISLTPVSNWTFNDLMQCIVGSSVKWLLTSQREMPSSVKLCTDDIGNFSATDTYIDRCVAFSMKGVASQHTSRLQAIVRKAHLDQTTVDVLVNTTAQNLDLRRGKVSAALLRAAGPSLQQECKQQHPRGIDYKEVAVTGGYNLQCKRVFHITLPVYSDASAKECIECMRGVMLTCLKTASDYKYKTIAFPALGTGALGYPAEIVAGEMFGCVERFKEHVDSTLDEIQFVIYPKDESLFQYFEHIQRSLTNPRKSSSLEPVERYAFQVKITGLKENIDDAKASLKTKTTAMPADVNKVVSDSIADVSRTKAAAVKEYYCDDVSDVGVKIKFISSTDHHRSEEGMDTSDNDGNTSTSGTVSRQPIIKRLFSWSKHSKNMQVYQGEQLIVKVYEADILTVPVDGIVNAANNDLQHCGGIARVIAKAAGETLLRECENVLLENNGDLPVTSVIRTCAGDLPYKCVLHAVGPCWSNYKPITKASLYMCEQDLMGTIMNCFERAEANGLTTIALPAICSGIFDVPRDVCAIQYARAVMKYGGNNTLKQIHFVDQNHEMIEIIHKTFDAMITHRKPPPYNTMVCLEQSKAACAGASTSAGSGKTGTNTANDRPEQRTHKTERENTTILVSYVSDRPEQRIRKTERENTTMLVSYVSDRVRLVCTFSPAYRFEVYHGDVLTLSGVDAIVCSENKSGDGKGVIAKLLLQCGGKGYKKNKALQFTSWRNPGDVITTPGGKSRYRWILHAVLSLKEPSSIASAYRNILTEASTRELASVALPLLGTGIGGTDASSSAEMLFCAWIEFCQHNGDGALALHLVIHDKPTADVVKAVLKRQIDGMKQTGANVFETNRPNWDLGNTMENDVTQDNDTTGEERAFMDTVVAVENCVICMDRVIDAKKLQCGHSFCTDCIEGYFRVKQVCPTCGKVYGVITGDQPHGIMEIIKTQNSVSGYERYKTIAITYIFKEGTQGADHPRPGTSYKGIMRVGYLPDNKEGREICAMLKVAFARKLIFTIGTSRTTGEEGVITWNDIHHKTNPNPNTQFGYPDSTYLQRVGEEIKVKGVTREDIDTMVIKQLEQDSYRHTFAS